MGDQGGGAVADTGAVMHTPAVGVLLPGAAAADHVRGRFLPPSQTVSCDDHRTPPAVLTPARTGMGILFLHNSFRSFMLSVCVQILSEHWRHMCFCSWRHSHLGVCGGPDHVGRRRDGLFLRLHVHRVPGVWLHHQHHRHGAHQSCKEARKLKRRRHSLLCSPLLSDGSARHTDCACGMRRSGTSGARIDADLDFGVRCCSCRSHSQAFPC